MKSKKHARRIAKIDLRIVPSATKEHILEVLKEEHEDRAKELMVRHRGHYLNVYVLMRREMQQAEPGLRLYD